MIDKKDVEKKENKYIKLRDNHEELLKKEEDKNYKIYTTHFKETTKKFNFLCELIKNQNIKISFLPSMNGWYDYEIVIKYKNVEIVISEDYNGKIKTYFKKNLNISYDIKTEVYKKLEKNKPLNYTFFKLTTKKLLKILEHDVELYNSFISADSEYEKNFQIKKNDVINKYKQIAKILKCEIKKKVYRECEYFNFELDYKILRCFKKTELKIDNQRGVIDNIYDVEYLLNFLVFVKKHNMEM